MKYQDRTLLVLSALCNPRFHHVPVQYVVGVPDLSLSSPGIAEFTAYARVLARFSPQTVTVVSAVLTYLSYLEYERNDYGLLIPVYEKLRESLVHPETAQVITAMLATGDVNQGEDRSIPLGDSRVYNQVVQAITNAQNVKSEYLRAMSILESRNLPDPLVITPRNIIVGVTPGVARDLTGYTQ